MQATGTDGDRAGPVTVDRGLVDAAVADFVEEVAAGAAPTWIDAMRAATADAGGCLAEQVADVSRSAVDATAPPGWTRLLGVLQVLLVLTVIGAAVWQLAFAPPEVAGWPGGWFVAVVAAGVALVLACAGGWMAGHSTRRRALHNAATTRQAVGEAVDRWVTGPVDAELATYAAWRRALETARSA
jgi:hypothetical protein